MDRRQQKTREAIFKAFSKLLEKKNYNNITIQEIIDEANIGRSTFYAHFETKDELLNAICGQIFGHIFSDVLNAEEHHDFSKDNSRLADKLTHLLYHLKEQQKDILHLLSGSSSDLFLRYFKLILSRLVDTFFARISLTMQPPPKPHNTACVLPWEEDRHWQSRSSGCSSS